MSDLTRTELERRHLADLHELASANDVPRFRSLSRTELIEAILEASDEGREESEAPEPEEWSPPDGEAESERAVEYEFESDEAHEEDEPEAPLELRVGVLDVVPDGYGFMRVGDLTRSGDDLYVSRSLVRRFGLRSGDELSGPMRPPGRSDRYASLLEVETINGEPADDLEDRGRPEFDELTPIAPRERFALAAGNDDLTARMIDLVAPIGKGQRCLVASPPGAGATNLLRELARALVATGAVTPAIVLVDSRPEEVTEWRRALDASVYGASSDESPEAQVRIAELALARAKRQAEQGRDVVLLVDSITRLARARGLAQGRTRRSGRRDGEESGSEGVGVRLATHWFSAARNTEEQGSLTIVAIARAESGSDFEQLVHETLSEIANMELRLDQELSRAGLFPAIDVNRSWSRHDPSVAEAPELGAPLRGSVGSMAPREAWQAVAERVRA